MGTARHSAMENAHGTSSPQAAACGQPQQAPVATQRAPFRPSTPRPTAPGKGAGRLNPRSKAHGRKCVLRKQAACPAAVYGGPRLPSATARVSTPGRPRQKHAACATPAFFRMKECACAARQAPTRILPGRSPALPAPAVTSPLSHQCRNTRQCPSTRQPRISDLIISQARSLSSGRRRASTVRHGRRCPVNGGRWAGMRATT